MSELFNRAYRLKIGDILIDGTQDESVIDIAFDVAKSVKREPNTLSLKVFNLSSEHRLEIEAKRDIRIELSAGYRGNIELIFSGDIRNTKTRKQKKNTVRSSREPLDIITEIEAADGGTSYRDSTVSKSYSPGTPVATIIRDIIASMGIGAGNLNDFQGDEISGLGATYASGTVIYGKARNELNRIVRSLGLRWSIQNGNLQLISGTTPIQETAIVLSPGTGLIGSPEKENDGTIACTTLLIPELLPGRKVIVESRDIRAQCIIKRVRFYGESYGNDWNAALELREY